MIYSTVHGLFWDSLIVFTRILFLVLFYFTFLVCFYTDYFFHLPSLQQDKERRLNGGGEGSGDGGGGAALEGLTAEGSSLTRSRSINRHKLVAHSTAMESIQADSDPIDEEDQVP